MVGNERLKLIKLFTLIWLQSWIDRDSQSCIVPNRQAVELKCAWSNMISEWWSEKYNYSHQNCNNNPKQLKQSLVMIQRWFFSTVTTLRNLHQSMLKPNFTKYFTQCCCIHIHHFFFIKKKVNRSAAFLLQRPEDFAFSNRGCFFEGSF